MSEEKKFVGSGFRAKKGVNTYINVDQLFEALGFEIITGNSGTKSLKLPKDAVKSHNGDTYFLLNQSLEGRKGVEMYKGSAQVAIYIGEVSNPTNSRTHFCVLSVKDENYQKSSGSGAPVADNKSFDDLPF